MDYSWGYDGNNRKVLSIAVMDADQLTGLPHALRAGNIMADAAPTSNSTYSTDEFHALVVLNRLGCAESVWTNSGNATDHDPGSQAWHKEEKRIILIVY
jgi:hypothetical protein